MASLSAALPGYHFLQYEGLRIKNQLNGLLLTRRNCNGKKRARFISSLCCALQPLEDLHGSKKMEVEIGLDNDGALGSCEWKALPDIWSTAADKYGDFTALYDPHHQPATRMSYNELKQSILDFAEGLRMVGILPRETVSLFADNSCRWLVADQGIMASGAIDAVRGVRSSVEELLFIYIHSDSVAIVLENCELYKKLLPHIQRLSNLKFIILLWGEKSQIVMDELAKSVLKVFNYDEILSKGRMRRLQNHGSLKQGHAVLENIATIVYTSGTTGNPKGVMLTHANLLHQVRSLAKVVNLKPGDRFLSLLPPWHMYERSCEYFALALGVEQVYTNTKRLKEDLKKFSPDYFVCVPLVFDMLYSAVHKQLLASSSVRRFIAFMHIRISLAYMEWKRIYEGRDLSRARKQTSPIVYMFEWILARIFVMILAIAHSLAQKLIYSKIQMAIGIKKAAISGGGSLAPHVDRFFEAIGITVLNGYGLTESSPVISVRVPENNVLGTVGKPIHETKVKVVDPESGEDLPIGARGLIKAYGPQIMKGYYKNNEARTLDENGWLDTGDLGWIAPYNRWGPARNCGGLLVLDGRAKDTIVLSTGENIEPTQIEAAVMQSRYIQHVMVVGQDQRRLGAIIIPNKEELQAAFEAFDSSDGAANIQYLIRKDLSEYTLNCPTQIGPFILIDEPFTVENGLLTSTMKMRRAAITKKYQTEIEGMFQRP